MQSPCSEVAANDLGLAIRSYYLEKEEAQVCPGLDGPDWRQQLLVVSEHGHGAKDVEEGEVGDPHAHITVGLLTVEQLLIARLHSIDQAQLLIAQHVTGDHRVTDSSRCASLTAWNALKKEPVRKVWFLCSKPSSSS